MKVSKTFRLSEEAVKILDSQANATQFLEQIILRGLEPSVPSTGISEERVIELIKLHAAKTEDKFVPKPPDPYTGYPCCEMKKPCKHWQWDSGLTCYVNIITGEQKELEASIEVGEL